MPTPGEHKTVQARILSYAEAIGWTFVSREEAEHRRGFDPEVPPADRAKNRSLFFDDLLDAKLREFNPRYADAEGALLGQFRHLHTDIYGNREFVEHRGIIVTMIHKFRDMPADLNTRSNIDVLLKCGDARYNAIHGPGPLLFGLSR